MFFLSTTFVLSLTILNLTQTYLDLLNHLAYAEGMVMAFELIWVGFGICTIVHALVFKVKAACIQLAAQQPTK